MANFFTYLVLENEDYTVGQFGWRVAESLFYGGLPDIQSFRDDIRDAEENLIEARSELAGYQSMTDDQWRERTKDMSRDSAQQTKNQIETYQTNLNRLDKMMSQVQLFRPETELGKSLSQQMISFLQDEIQYQQKNLVRCRKNLEETSLYWQDVKHDLLEMASESVSRAEQKLEDTRARLTKFQDFLEEIERHFGHRPKCEECP